VLTDIIPAESSFAAGERMCELVKVCASTFYYPSLLIELQKFQRVSKIVFLTVFLVSSLTFKSLSKIRSFYCSST
jgi:hypothetical protein